MGLTMQIRQGRARRVLPAVVALALAAMPGVAGAQSDAKGGNIGAAPGPTLKDQLSECFADHADADGQITIGFELDEAGQILGIPENLADDQADAAMRKIFLGAVVRLDECAPFDAAGGPDGAAQYAMVLGPEGLESLDIIGDAAEDDPFSEAKIERKQSPGTEATEAALGLSRSQRRELQHRLKLLGHDPGGADGVLGQRSRDAIESWQATQDLPRTGYLDADQWALLKSQSETAYQDFVQHQPTQRVRHRVRVCTANIFGVRVCHWEYR